MKRREFLLLSAISPVMAKDFITNTNNVFLNKQDMRTLIYLDNRLGRVRRYIGFGNFNFLSLDEMFYYGRNYSSIGKFTKSEKDLIEKLFFQNPQYHGFYGDRTINNITNKISTKDIIKVPYSGHFIYRGKPYDDYNRILKDVGSDIILTSGVRNVVKQLSLYVSKIKSVNGNLSKASASIAPPAFTYHAISDFDVGKKGWGSKNFTSAFARTDEFRKMRKLDYIDIRYTVNNKDGVRFEPWHIKVI
ncbi:MAG: D-alanyl-D-alanine carboxypeptidase family protein [Campylobacterota bacterium]|nr:D-alanyl-D-alanine carboxypeptidase family protein [Campylobacterota bacterium]